MRTHTHTLPGDRDRFDLFDRLSEPLSLRSRDLERDLRCFLDDLLFLLGDLDLDLPLLLFSFSFSGERERDRDLRAFSLGFSSANDRFPSLNERFSSLAGDLDLDLRFLSSRPLDRDLERDLRRLCFLSPDRDRDRRFRSRDRDRLRSREPDRARRLCNGNYVRSWVN